jgi:hypothetical protein
LPTKAVKKKPLRAEGKTAYETGISSDDSQLTLWESFFSCPSRLKARLDGKRSPSFHE